jgi:hypothetical protein
MAVLVLAALITSLAGCSSRVSHATDYPLADEPIPAYDGTFEAYVPSGWILRPDTLGVMKLRGEEGEMAVTAFGLDSVTALEVHRQGLPLLAEIAAGLRVGATGKPAGGAAPVFGEQFRLGGKECSDYELRTKGATVRGVVFRLRDTYYECEASREGAPDKKADESLYKVQNSFIARLR